MPKADRASRCAAHISSAKPAQPPLDLPSFDFSKSDDRTPSLEYVDVRNFKRSKKEKQTEKRQLFLQKLGPSPQKLSKSSARRLKRKRKEQLSGGLENLQSAIQAVEMETVNQDEDLTTIASSKAEEKQRSSAKTDTVGKNASSTLTKAQRKRILELERMRHPLILTNSEFSSNPFRTIRTHVQNTLLKHDSQS